MLSSDNSKILSRAIRLESVAMLTLGMVCCDVDSSDFRLKCEPNSQFEPRSYFSLKCEPDLQAGRGTLKGRGEQCRHPTPSFLGAIQRAEPRRRNPRRTRNRRRRRNQIRRGQRWRGFTQRTWRTIARRTSSAKPALAGRMGSQTEAIRFVPSARYFTCEKTYNLRV